MTNPMRRIGLVLVVALSLTFAGLHAEAADTGGLGSSSTATFSPFVAWPLRVLGALLVMYGIFAVPGDQKKFENYLERWWVWVEERREAGLKWQTAFLQVVATVVSSWFDRLFGDRLLSRRAVVASITLSLGSLYLLSGIVTLLFLSSAQRAPLLLSTSIGESLLGLVALWLVMRGGIKAMIVFDITFIGITAAGALLA